MLEVGAAESERDSVEVELTKVEEATWDVNTGEQVITVYYEFSVEGVDDAVLLTTNQAAEAAEQLGMELSP